MKRDSKRCRQSIRSIYPAITRSRPRSERRKTRVIFLCFTHYMPCCKILMLYRQGRKATCRHLNLKRWLNIRFVERKSVNRGLFSPATFPTAPYPPRSHRPPQPPRVWSRRRVMSGSAYRNDNSVRGRENPPWPKAGKVADMGDWPNAFSIIEKGLGSARFINREEC